MSGAESPASDPVLVARLSAAHMRMMMYLVGGAMCVVAVAAVLIEWRSLFVTLPIGVLVCGAMYRAAEAREKHPVVRLIIDQAGIQLGADPSSRIAWDTIAGLRLFYKLSWRRGWYLGVSILDADVFNRFSRFADRMRAFVTQMHEIHIPIQALDVTRDDIRKAVARHHPRLTPP